MTWRTWRDGVPDEGTASVFVLGMVVVLMVVAGLVVDGGRAVNARAAAMDAAEQAARSGANQLGPDALHDGVVRIDPAAARAAASEYLLAQGYPQSGITVTASENQVVVAVRDTETTTLLSLAGITSFAAEGHATARAAVGILDEIPAETP